MACHKNFTYVSECMHELNCLVPAPKTQLSVDCIQMMSICKQLQADHCSAKVWGAVLLCFKAICYNFQHALQTLELKHPIQMDINIILVVS